MGARTNRAGDMIPPNDLYAACEVIAKHVKYLGNYRWDFEALNTMKIDPAFEALIYAYLDNVLNNDSEAKGWKLPETTLIYPWIVRMFPDIRYIYWVRDPRDSILSNHITDDLKRFCVPYDAVDDIRERRAISWKYQTEIVKATPKPKHIVSVRFEDFVLKQDETLKKLEDYLGIPLAKIPVRPESVGRWKNDNEKHDFECFQSEMKTFGYKS